MSTSFLPRASFQLTDVREPFEIRDYKALLMIELGERLL
jgi:hypothetical protein